MTELYAIEPQRGDLIEKVYGGNSPHKVIRASAGSGKTYQLTRRYLRLLRHGAAPESMLATTFTRKAAGEILARVLGTLAGAARDRDERRKLSETLGGDPLTADDCRAMLSRLARSLHRVSISTIDSFFNRMAQGFRFELDLPIHPQLVDAGHPLAAQLRQQAIEALLADDDLETMLSLLRRLHHDTADRSVTRAIDQIVSDHHEVYRQAPGRDLWTTLQPHGLLEGEALERAIEALEALEAALPTTKTGKPRARWANGLGKDVAAARVGDWKGFLKGGIPAKLASGEAAYDGAEIEADWRGVYGVLMQHAAAHEIQLIAWQTEACHGLLRRFDAHYDRLRKQHRLLLFSDLTHKLARLLPSLGEEVLTDVYYRLDGRVTHLLLDEFQDTSVDQWSILEPIAQEVASHSDGSRSLFCVGDVKQAIYGWRGGCADLFDEVEALAGAAESLSKSWRSSQIVLDAVNQVFGTIADNPGVADVPQAGRRWAAGFEPHEAAKDLPGFVELVTSPAEAGAGPGAGAKPQAAEEEEEDEGVDSHEGFAAERVRRMYHTAPGRQIGVLVARKKTVHRMLYELRRLGLPVSGEAGNPVTDSPAVSAVLAAITLADHPGHTAAAFHVLNSPMGEVVGLRSLDPRDTARAAIDIRRSLLTTGYAGTLAKWAAALAPSCDQRSLARLTQLVELAERYEPMESLRPSRFVAFVQATPVEEPSPAPIRVMTIHASKGLEFDTVVLPELDGRLPRTPKLLVERDEPTGPIKAVYRFPPAALHPLLPRVQQAFEAHRCAEREEDLCNLYVAMTRAKHALHMIVRPLTQRKDGSPGTGGWTSPAFATILRRALGRTDESFDGGQVLYEDGDPAWRHGDPPAACGLAQQPSPEPLRVTLTQPDDAHRRGWARVTPSSLHGGGRVRAADLLRLDEAAGVVTGRVIHRWFESIGFIDDADGGVPDDAALLRIAMGEGVDRARADELLGRFREMLARPAVREVLVRGGAAELWRERSFAVRLGGALLRGQFDRVLVFRDAHGAPQRATLIDFKSDRVTEAALGARAEHYRPQIDAYRAALSQMLNLDPARVEAKLVFLRAGVTRTLV